MAFQECPSCFLRIIPSEDGTCPACQCNLLEAAGRRPNQATMWLVKGKLLPQLCCTCARATDHTVTIGEREFGESDGTDDSAVLWTIKAAGVAVVALFTGCIGFIFIMVAFLWHTLDDADDDSGEVSRAVQGEIPQCHDCERECEITVCDVDFRQGAIKVVVHEQFERDYYRLNS